MNYLENICTILHRAFIEIRLAAHEKNMDVPYFLADLLHTIPISLVREQERGGDYKKTFNLLYERAEERGLKSWVDQALSASADE